VRITNFGCGLPSTDANRSVREIWSAIIGSIPATRNSRFAVTMRTGLSSGCRNLARTRPAQCGAKGDVF
jgi:hypothetical protein